jgi:acetyl esterase/lipase
MVRRSWLLGVIGASLGLSSGCVGAENNKPTASSSDAEPSPQMPLRLAYASDTLQFGDLRLPKGAGPHPVVVVLHGGCWINSYGLDLMHDMSAALTAEGLATWNVEYRRLGDVGSDYPNTLLDVGLAVDHLRNLAVEHHLDLSKVTTVGHSAGAHLAVWVAARHKLDAKNPLRGTDPLSVRAAVSLAGVLDLAESVNLGVCNGVAATLMQGSPSEVPTHYSEA